MKARMLQAGDREACYALAREANTEGRYARYELNMAKVELLFNRAIEEDDFFCIVVEHEGALVALMYGLVTEHFYSVMRFAITARSVFCRVVNASSRPMKSVASAMSFAVPAPVLKPRPASCVFVLAPTR